MAMLETQVVGTVVFNKQDFKVGSTTTQDPCLPCENPVTVYDDVMVKAYVYGIGTIYMNPSTVDGINALDFLGDIVLSVGILRVDKRRFYLIEHGSTIGMNLPLAGTVDKYLPTNDENFVEDFRTRNAIFSLDDLEITYPEFINGFYCESSIGYKWSDDYYCDLFTQYAKLENGFCLPYAFNLNSMYNIQVNQGVLQYFQYNQASITGTPITKSGYTRNALTDLFYNYLGSELYKEFGVTSYYCYTGTYLTNQLAQKDDPITGTRIRKSCSSYILTSNELHLGYLDKDNVFKYKTLDLTSEVQDKLRNALVNAYRNVEIRDEINTVYKQNLKTISSRDPFPDPVSTLPVKSMDNDAVVTFSDDSTHDFGTFDNLYKYPFYFDHFNVNYLTKFDWDAMKEYMKYNFYSTIQNDCYQLFKDQLDEIDSIFDCAFNGDESNRTFFLYIYPYDGQNYLHMQLGCTYNCVSNDSNGDPIVLTITYDQYTPRFKQIAKVDYISK